MKGTKKRLLTTIFVFPQEGGGVFPRSNLHGIYLTLLRGAERRRGNVTFFDGSQPIDHINNANHRATKQGENHPRHHRNMDDQ